MPDLKVAEWLIIFATIAGPVLAVQAQKFIERVRENRQRKIRLFCALMATRAARVAPDHVQALNMIDLEFYGRKLFGVRMQREKEKKVIEAWRIYHDHLNQQIDRDGLPAWTARGDELFTDLLHQLAIALEYDFDKVQLKRGIYYPRAHDENEMAQLIIRNSLVRILTGQESLKMAVTSFPVSQDALERQRQVQDALLQHLTGNQPLKVTIANDGQPDSN